MPVFNANVSRRPTGFPFLDDAPGLIPFAHRGGAYHPEIEGLENTLAAFRHASALGYRYLETDVHATRDGVLLAFHDAILDRVTDSQGRHRLSRVRRGPGRADRRPREGPHAGRSCSTSSPKPGSTSTSSRPVRSSRWSTSSPTRAVQDRVLVGSFSGAQLSEFRRLTGGRVATSAPPARGGGVPRSLPAASWPTSSRGAACRRCRSRTRRGPLTVASARLVRRAHAAGKHVHVWTVDDPAEMQRADRAGRRRADDRPHRHTRGRSWRSRRVGRRVNGEGQS